MVEKEQSSAPQTGEALSEEGPFKGFTEAPDLLVDGFQGVIMRNGIVRLNLFTINIDPNDFSTYRKVVATLSMSLPTYVQIHAAMTDMLRDFEKDGFIKRVPAASDDKNES